VSVARKCAALAVSAALLTGIPVAPAFADQGSRSSDPQIAALQESAQATLRRAVREARATYAHEVTDARAQRAKARVAPRAQRAAGLKQATSKAERRLVRRAYKRAIAPVNQEYRTAKQSALAKRNATIDKALADYLVKTGKPEIAAALATYREATAIAGVTLELALKSGRDTLRTDTADERAQLVSDLEEAMTEGERLDAWLDFQAASAKDRKAYERSIASARATYSSAMSEARREFKLATGRSIKKLLALPFRI
jgi:hypothetical protein